MRILWVATKLPWPPIDGGRLLMVRSFQALAEAGAEITVVAPDGGDAEAAAEARAALAPWAHVEPVATAPRGSGRALLTSLTGGRPWTLARHALPAVAQRVSELLQEKPFDVVQAEQVQALGSVPNDLIVPLVWRAQNVESDLWRATASHRAPPMRWLLAREARRLARHEGLAVGRAAAAVALTTIDTERLRGLAEEAGTPGAVQHLPTPFPETLPAAESSLPGEPAVVVLGSAGWWPNREGTAWFLRRVVPKLRRVVPGVRVHCFGPVPPEVPRLDSRRWTEHPAPKDSRDAFAPGAVLAVPLFVASGVRMKILEAWARGVPVVATSVAARGLDATSGKELLVADDAADFATALARVGRDPDLARSMVAEGRALLRRQHSAQGFAQGLLKLYQGLTTTNG